MRGDEHRSKAARRPVRVRAARGPLNEVVCGAMMLAYERAGKWNEVCHIDSRCLHVTALLMGLACCTPVWTLLFHVVLFQAGTYEQSTNAGAV